jgi:protein CpxP
MTHGAYGLDGVLIYLTRAASLARGILDARIPDDTPSPLRKTLMKTITAALTSAFLVAGAHAQTPSSFTAMTPSSDASTAAMTKSDAKRDMAVESHIKNMHAQLQITPAEETQWAAVAQTMRDSAIETDQAIDKREALVSSGSAVDNLNAYGNIAQAHADGVKKLAAAFAPLYASMSDDQKKAADALFAHRAHEGKQKVTK